MNDHKNIFRKYIYNPYKSKSRNNNEVEGDADDKQLPY